MYEKEIYNVGCYVLTETLTVTRNVLLLVKYPDRRKEGGKDDVENWYTAVYVQGISDAIHNIPRAMQVQDERLLIREYQRLCLFLEKVDVKKVSEQSRFFFELYIGRMVNAVQPYTSERG